jgi:hypothetical protein
VGQCEKDENGLNILQEVGAFSIETHQLANGSKTSKAILSIIED